MQSCHMGRGKGGAERGRRLMEMKYSVMMMMMIFDGEGK